jgi:hypothetical protein
MESKKQDDRENYAVKKLIFCTLHAPLDLSIQGYILLLQNVGSQRSASNINTVRKYNNVKNDFIAIRNGQWDATHIGR